MSQTITIDPVTRLEGHGRITLKTNGQGEISEACFTVTQVRGFEKFSEGRPYYEMPSLMARICGICPVSHLLASAKACDAIMAVRIPPAAALLREAIHRRQAAPRPQPGPEHSVARTQLLLPRLARPASGHGRRPRRPQYLRRGQGAS
jgi:NAD-reducing hydrogenase large subunit